MEVCLDEKVLEENKLLVNHELSRPYYDLFNIIRKKGGNNNVYDSLTSMFSTQKSICQATSKKFDAKKTIAKDFLQIHSYILSAEKGLYLLKDENHSNRIFNAKNIDFEIGQNSLRRGLIKTYKDNIEKHADSKADVVAITKGFFQWIKENAEKQYNCEKYSDYYMRTKTLNIKLNDVVINNKSYVSSTSVNKNQIVGNKELISELESSLQLLYLYDVKNKLHPHMLKYNDYVQRILAIGSPGCGKSLTLEAMINEARTISETIYKPLFIHDISNDLKSKYYGESAHNLKKVFDEINKGDALHIILADDLDTVIFGRKENEFSENISVFGEFIKHIESATSKNKGNYLLWATTNKPENIDQALYRRFQQKILVKGPETRQDYIDLMKIKLSGYERDGLVKINNWQQIGNKLYEKQVSGSAIADIASSLTKKIVQTEFPSNFATMDAYKISESLTDIYNTITEKDLNEAIDRVA